MPELTPPADLDAGLVQTISRTHDKYRLTDIVIRRDGCFVGWQKGEEVEGEFVPYAVDNFTFEDREATDEEPEVTDWTDLKAQQRLQDFVALIKQALRQKGCI